MSAEGAAATSAPAGGSGAAATPATGGTPAGAAAGAGAGAKKRNNNRRRGKEGRGRQQQQKQQLHEDPDCCDDISSDEEGSPRCIVCSEKRGWWGKWNSCGHAVCWRCALRIRYINPDQSKSTMCCVCQRESAVEGITITANLEGPPPTAAAREESYLKDKTGWNVWYETEQMRDDVEFLRGLYCLCWEECGIETPFASLKALQEHMWARHKHGLCTVCFDANTAFPAEQTLYTAQQLRLHENPFQRCAKDTSAFGGHPLCHFCNKLMYDADALYMHMREAHCLCDLCEASTDPDAPKLNFHPNMKALTWHFKEHHVVCKTCDRQYAELQRRGKPVQQHPTEFTFATEIQLLKHNRDVHGATGDAVDTAVRESLFSYGRGGAKGGGGSGGGGGGSGGNRGDTEERGGAGEQRATVITFDLGRGRKKSATLGSALPQANERRRGKSDKPFEGLVAKLLEMKAGDAAVATAKQFVSGGVRAVEFYGILRSCLAPGGGDIPSASMAALCSLVPDAERREALRLAHNMATSTERVKGEALHQFTAAAASIDLDTDFPTMPGGSAAPAAAASTHPNAAAASAAASASGAWRDGGSGSTAAGGTAAARLRQGMTRGPGGGPGRVEPAAALLDSAAEFPTLGGKTTGVQAAAAWRPPVVLSSHPDPAAAASSSSSSSSSSAAEPAAQAPPPQPKPSKAALSSVDDFPTLGRPGKPGKAGGSSPMPLRKTPRAPAQGGGGFQPQGAWGQRQDQ